MKKTLLAPQTLAPRTLARAAGLAASGIVTGLGILATGMAHAQDDAATGPSLTFGINQGFEISTNRALDPDPAGQTLLSTTQFSLGLRDETARMTFALDASTGLRIVDGPDTAGAETTLADPQITLAYSRLGATSRLDLGAGYQVIDIAFLRPLAEFTNPDGTVTLPPDFNDLQGSGTRQSLNFDVALTLREDAPFGLVLAAGVTDLRYADVTDPDLSDSTRSYASVTARLDINAVTAASVGLSYSQFTDAGGTSDTVGLDTGLTISRPDGDLRFSLGLEDRADGTRLSFGVGRDFDLPRGALSFDLGAVRGTDGAVNLTGAVQLTQTFAQGTASASLSQSLSSGTDDAEQLRTTLALGLSRELTPLAALDLGLTYVISEDTATGLGVNSATLSASLGYALGPDWTLNTGYRYETRDEDGVGLAQDHVLFLGLQRDFELPL